MKIWSRREVLVAGAAAAVVAACGGDDGATADATVTSTSTTTPAADTTVASTDTTASAGGSTILSAADFDGLATCALTPEQTAGPFPLDEQFVRRDITEGHPGHPLRLGLRVVDASCAPVGGAAVEVWHADATGDYSAFADNGGGKDEAEGTTFLRGTQTAGEDGIVEFATVYPGWYPGRAVHIHVKVHVGGDEVHTGQLFFRDAFTDAVYKRAPYKARGERSMRNAGDSIYGSGGSRSLLAMTTVGKGYVGAIDMGVRRS
jgi:protocatechuate 3,4-dioxygenase beta subunit